jgi:hypothetical protein
MCFIWLQPSWVAARNSMNVAQDSKQALDIFWRATMNYIEVPRRNRYSLDYGRGHTHYNDLDAFFSESKKDLAKLGFCGFHGEFE